MHTSSNGFRARALLIAGVASLAFVGCAEAQQAVGDAVEQVSDAAGEARANVTYCTAAGQVAVDVNNEDWDAAIEHGETMVANAPDAIAADAGTLLDGARRLRDGERAVAADPQFRAAADRVEDYTRDFCDPTN